MPDPQGNVTAGQDDVIGNSPVNQPPAGQGSASMGDELNGPQSAPQTSPTQKPQFFKTLLYALGKGLLEGTRAGIEAPMSPQGPSIAAANAPNIPVQDAQRQAAMAQAKAAPQQISDQQTLSKLQVETAQINLAIMHHNLIHIDDARSDGYYKEGQGVSANLIEKGNAQQISTGSQADIQDLYLQQRSLHPDDNFMMLPTPGQSRGSDNEYQLLKYNPQDRFSEDGDPISLPEVKGADGSVYPALTIPGPKKGQSIKDWNARATTLGKLQTTRDLDISRSAANKAKADEGQKNRDMRWSIAEANNENRRVVAQIKQAQSSGDKELLQALNEKKTHIDKLAKLSQDSNKIGNWLDLSGGQKQGIQQEQDAIDAADQRIKALSGNKSAGAKVRVKLSNGKIGMIDQGQFDEKTMTKVP